MCVPVGPEDYVKFPIVGVTGSCDLSNMDAGNRTTVLCKNMLFTVEGAQDEYMGCLTSYPGVIISLDCDCPWSWRSLEMLLAVLFRQKWH